MKHRMHWASCERRLLRNAWVGTFFSILSSVATAQPVEMLGDLLDGLEAEQREQALFPLAAKERTEWTYIPLGHEGLPLREMSEDQRKATDTWVRSALSPSGVETYLGVLELENELWENTWFKWFRDPGKYYLAVFGNPGTQTPWSWRFGGHHLSINITHGEGGPWVTPFFTGANPATVTTGERAGLRVLGVEEDMARALMLSLDTDQRQKALIDEDAPWDIITGWDTEVELACCEGIAATDLSNGQRQELRLLVDRVIGKLDPALAAGLVARMEGAGIEKLYFAWAGGLQTGEGHYFRVHGPTLLIEYDNTQNDNNHVHLVLREPGLDFGGDPLRAHISDAHLR